MELSDEHGARQDRVPAVRATRSISGAGKCSTGRIQPEQLQFVVVGDPPALSGHRAARRPASGDAFDPGAKYHIANNVPYLRYFLAYILEFQFYQSACQQAGWQGPLHRCTVYGNRQIGERFNRMMEMGASRPWPEALEAFTGTRRMDGSAMVAYFQPLMQWMETQNRGRQCGWQ